MLYVSALIKKINKAETVLSKLILRLNERLISEMQVVAYYYVVIPFRIVKCFSFLSPHIVNLSVVDNFRLFISCQLVFHRSQD